MLYVVLDTASTLRGGRYQPVSIAVVYWRYSAYAERLDYDQSRAVVAEKNMPNMDGVGDLRLQAPIVYSLCCGGQLPAGFEAPLAFSADHSIPDMVNLLSCPCLSSYSEDLLVSYLTLKT